MREVVAKPCMSDSEAAALAGKLLGEDSYDTVLREDANILREDGTLLAVFRKNIVPFEAAAAAYEALRDAAQETNNRGVAAGPVDPSRAASPGESKGGLRFRPLKKDGTLSRQSYAMPVNSGIVGFFDPSPRFPFCRQTAYTMRNPDRIARALPYLRAVSEVYREVDPEHWEAQRQAIEKTHPDFYFPGTVFTTITVNRNWQTAVHLDAGNLKTGHMCIAGFKMGSFDGGFTVFPKYRLAVDLDTCDVFVGNNHSEWHGNSPIRPGGNFERLSFVMYFREGLIGSGSNEEELAKARAVMDGRLAKLENRDEETP